MALKGRCPSPIRVERRCFFCSCGDRFLIAQPVAVRAGLAAACFAGVGWERGLEPSGLQVTGACRAGFRSVSIPRVFSVPAAAPRLQLLTWSMGVWPTRSGSYPGFPDLVANPVARFFWAPCPWVYPGREAGRRQQCVRKRFIN